MAETFPLSTRSKRSSKHLIAAGVAALSLTFAYEANAACLPQDRLTARVTPRIEFRASPVGTSSQDPKSHGPTTIVGLWKVSFLAGDGPDVLYQGLQQWHTGGTELMVDNGVPPSFGNVCVGVWKEVAPRTYRLRHTTFNWDENGNSVGTFELLMTVRLDRSGNAYAGTYVSNSYDLAGNVIPELHAAGRLIAARITVE